VNEASTKSGAALYGAALTPGGRLGLAGSRVLQALVFRSVNIALVNELKTIFDGCTSTSGKSSKQRKTKPFGFMPFYPGLDSRTLHSAGPFYLSWKAAEHGYVGPFHRAGWRNQHPHASARVNKLMLALKRAWKGVEGLRACAFRAGLQSQRGRRSGVALVRDHRAVARHGGALSNTATVLPCGAPTRKHGDLGMRSIRSAGFPARVRCAPDCNRPTTSSRTGAVHERKLVVDTRNIIAASLRRSTAVRSSKPDRRGA